MAISDFLSPDRIIIRKRSSKDRLLDELIHMAAAAVPKLDIAEVRERIRERESDVSTNIERGVAVPHAIFEELPKSLLAVGICREGLEWEKQEGAVVYLVVLLLGSRMTHLSVLSEVAGVLRDKGDFASVLAAQTEEEVFHILTRHDSGEVRPILDRNADVSKVLFEGGT